jgi:hypothetical protein
MAGSPRSSTRRRVTLAATAATTVIAGLLVHEFGNGTMGDIIGDALYAILMYLLLACLMPRSLRSAVAALAIMFCCAVELLQLTELPQRATEAFPAAALLLGAGFDTRDLIVYAVAVVAVMLVDVAVSRSSGRGRRRGRAA